ncbi:DUF4352 domain-containing protein [Nocardia sp. NPDC060256]|uniref:DUF4352 domain-containing protein n=1 Tax=unclassified Nocardia TaxID=2637762 RepID=UPI00365A89BE
MTSPQGEYPPQQPPNPNWGNQPAPGGGQQPPGQFAPPPRYGQPPQKKSKGGKIVLIVVAVVIGLCGFGAVIAAVNGGDKKSDTTTSSAAAPGPSAAGESAAPPAAKPPAEKPSAGPGLNTPVRDGKFEFVVTGVQVGLTEVGDNPYLQRKAQGAYTIVSMTVKNISNKPQGFSPSDQYLFDTGNRKFENDSMAAINLQADTSMYASLNPGNTVTAQVVFDLPADAVPSHIVLHDSMFSGGAEVTLR